jgi:predicted DNA-binding transcriptional regulator AlpA
VTQQHNTPPKASSKRLLTEAAAAEYISMSRSYLRQDRMNGAREGRTPGPAYIRIGTRAIRYPIEALDAWIDGLKNNAA